MSVKIQINSLEALERLLGGDTALELELRQSVVEAFAQKHLKALAVTDTFTKSINTMLVGIQAAAQDEIAKKVGSWHNSKLELKSEIIGQIKQVVRNEVDSIVRNTIEETTKALLAEDALANRIAERIQYDFLRLEKQKMIARVGEVVANLGEKIIEG